MPSRRHGSTSPARSTAGSCGTGGSTGRATRSPAARSARRRRTRSSTGWQRLTMPGLHGRTSSVRRRASVRRARSRRADARHRRVLGGGRLRVRHARQRGAHARAARGRPRGVGDPRRLLHLAAQRRGARSPTSCSTRSATRENVAPLREHRRVARSPLPRPQHRARPIPSSAFADINHTTAAGSELVAAALWRRRPATRWPAGDLQRARLLRAARRLGAGLPLPARPRQAVVAVRDRPAVLRVLLARVRRHPARRDAARVRAWHASCAGVGRARTLAFAVGLIAHPRRARRSTSTRGC